MERDIKVGLVLGIILVALIAVLFFRRSPRPEQELALLEQVDPRPDELPVVRTRAEPYRVPPEYLRSILGSRLASARKPGQESEADSRDETEPESPPTVGDPLHRPVEGGLSTENTATVSAPTPLAQLTPPPSPELLARPVPGRRYVTRKGDTLASIARRAYGKETLYRLIYEANKDRLADPAELPLGLELYIPEAPEEAATPTVASGTAGDSQPSGETSTRRDEEAHRAAAPGGTYVVRPGDTLRSIARAVYGRESMYRAILRANRDRLASPNDLRPGMQLELP